MPKLLSAISPPILPDTLGVLLATGAHPRMVGFQGEGEFKGRGVAYCATCDGEFFTGKQIFVIGGGFAAAEESVFLTKFASQRSCTDHVTDHAVITWLSCTTQQILTNETKGDVSYEE